MTGTSQQITIIQINDTHGYLSSHPEQFWAGGRPAFRIAGGYGRIAGLLQQIRRETNGRTLALDCGDTLHGTYAPVATKGGVMLPVLEQMGFAAMTAHWDFAYGPKRLQEIADRLPYPVLAINCYDKDSKQLVFPPYLIQEVGGVRVGIIGIAAYIVDKLMPPSFSEGVYLTLGDAELPGYIHRLRHEEGVDLVVVIAHLGFPQEMKLARTVPGIDVLLSAHTHNRLGAPARINDTLVIQSGSHGSFAGRLDLTLEGGKISRFDHHLLVVDEGIDADPEVAATVDNVMAPYRDMLAEVVGETRTALTRGRVLETTMDNFILQSLLHSSDAEIAFSHGWRYGAPVPPGPITLGDLYQIIPMDPPIFTAEIRGEALWDMLEENLHNVFAADPYEQIGGSVKRSLGLNGYIRPQNPRGHRLSELFVNGGAVEPSRSYRIAFVTTQAVPERYAEKREKLGLSAVEALRRYLADEGPVAAPLRDTFVAI
ncbi:MAG: bifunctional metallophosphatase/5'-nucleotidase [Anaerolineae bacterium]|nr:bifunctional metallophosphatase/5'-nucleotidase [Anaerolineae bacterium]